jgi:hypothetical protein
MRYHHIALHRRRWGASLVVLGALAACDSPTAPESLAVTVQTVALASEAERNAWPFTPTVHGGPSVVVRGTALITCARPIGNATRRGSLVELHIAGEPVSFCPASIAGWQPLEATISGLAPASYRVRVTAVGHVGHAEWVVNVVQP